MQHILVFSYIFTILIGVSAMTILWLAGQGSTNKHAKVMKPFITMLLVLNVYDLIIYYMDHIMNRPSDNLMLSFGDCLLAVLVIMWLNVECRLVGMEQKHQLIRLGQGFLLGYLAVWFIAVCFFTEYAWIRLIIDIPLVCLLVIGSASLLVKGKKDGVEPAVLQYKGLITLLIATTYLTYLISESGLFLGTGKNLMDGTIFYWLIINAANLYFMYKKDFAEAFLQDGANGKVELTLEETMELVKQQYELTKREIEILTEVYDGKTNTQIAEDLFISESTVKAHIYNIFRKMNVKSRVEAVCTIRETKEG